MGTKIFSQALFQIEPLMTKGRAFRFNLDLLLYVKVCRPTVAGTDQQVWVPREPRWDY